MNVRNLVTRIVVLTTLLASSAVSQEWTAPVRGSWIQKGEPRLGDVLLVAPGQPAEIILAGNAPSPVRQAAVFLASDLEKITGQRPAILSKPTGSGAAIHLVTLGLDHPAALPDPSAWDKIKGQWEAHAIVTGPGNAIWLIGANARGTAFAAYTLSERLGIDPLYLWTGYRPEQHRRLVLKSIDYRSAPPTFKYRGLFHDDEDILPRPFDYAGKPLQIGNVPLVWYEKFFETALRLRMNMVAPYTRTHRRFDVQQRASDWGLIYTSHHYDILLSNPFGFRRFGLAEKRGVSGDWNWLSNSENMLKYWRAGVEENGSLDCLWPVGLRGTDDYPYPFPKDMPTAEQNRVFQDVIKAQIEATRTLNPAGKAPPVFTFTLYGEMLDKYLVAGDKFEMPGDVVLIWPDDNDGRMRALPQTHGKWKHGIYYHLAYYGPVTKQSMRVIGPTRIANEFKKVVQARATEYMLLNVSELREFVRETRMIADICWDAPTALADTPTREFPKTLLPHVPTEAREPLPADLPSKSADRFARWFCAEYFGAAAAPRAQEAYTQYEQILDRWDKQWYAGDRVVGAINSLVRKFAGQEFAPARPETLPTLRQMKAQLDQTFDVIADAKAGMDVHQKRFFFENCELPLRVLAGHTEAAITLVQAMEETDLQKAWRICEEALRPLERLENELARAEYPPFEGWYAKTFIRHEETGLNLHRPYEALRLFLSSGGTQLLRRPPNRPAQEFLPVLESYRDRE